jgi:hypothetical protein
MTGLLTRLRCLEPAGLVLLVFAPVLFVGTLHYARTGRDLTLAFYVGLAGFVLVGAWLLDRGRWGPVVAGAIMLVSVPVLFFLADTIGLWSGVHEAVLVVRVRDADTGQGIEGATVSVSLLGDHSEGAASRTGPDGTARLRCRFRSGGADSLVRQTGSFCLSEHLTVDATGYRGIREPLWKHLAESWDLYGPPLPVIEVTLKKAIP